MPVCLNMNHLVVFQFQGTDIKPFKPHSCIRSAHLVVGIAVWTDAGRIKFFSLLSVPHHSCNKVYKTAHLFCSLIHTLDLDRNIKKKTCKIHRFREAKKNNFLFSSISSYLRCTFLLHLPLTVAHLTGSISHVVFGWVINSSLVPALSINWRKKRAVCLFKPRDLQSTEEIFALRRGGKSRRKENFGENTEDGVLGPLFLGQERKFPPFDGQAVKRQVSISSLQLDKGELRLLHNWGRFERIQFLKILKKKKIK